MTARMNVNDPESYKFGVYRDWNLYCIPWLEGDIKIAATRYEFMDLRYPVVHKNFKDGGTHPEIQREIAEKKVKEMIDEIETEGFDVYVRREFPGT